MTDLYLPLAAGDARLVRPDAVLRQNRITWTGHVRDTCVFSPLPGEESALLLRAGLVSPAWTAAD